MKLTKVQKEIMDRMFDPGKFVMLHCFLDDANGKEHPDSGRIGKIISNRPENMCVEFFDDDLIGKLSAYILPRKYWLPVPESLVEEYHPRAKKRGWRLSKYGVDTFLAMGWQSTDCTHGKDAKAEK